jgi:pyruvate dehydrogenase E1 component beta subunit
MLREAIACDDPVIFYNPKRRYRDRGGFDDEEGVRISALPLDAAASCGPDVPTLIGYGGTVLTYCLDVAEVVAADGH